MAGGSRDDDDIITDINVTPLVDITLVLLIIFMVTANLIVAPSIKVELPTAASGADTEPSTVAITIARDGKVYLNGRETHEAELRTAIQAEVAKDPKTQAIIAADKNVIHGRVVWAIDLVKQLGIDKFAINIDPGAIEAPPP